MAVISKDDNRRRIGVVYPYQPGNTMHDDARFTGAGTGEDEVIVVAFVGNNGMLHRIKSAGDSFQGGGRDIFF